MITGGLGGIGVEVVKWMLSMGARTIVLLGRNLPSKNHLSQIDDWNRNGNCIVVFQVDIGYEGNCRQTLKSIQKLGLPPLRGIMHAAGVLLDAITIFNQSQISFEKVYRPKVYGGWYLHKLTAENPMEFFVMFSFLSGIVGNPGHSNHCSANIFLDALTYHRKYLGLPATTVNWGNKYF